MKNEKTKTKVKSEANKLFKDVSKTRKQKKKKYNTKNIVLITIVTLGIAFASLVLAFGLYVVFSSPDFDTSKLYYKEASILYDKYGEEITRFGSQNREIKKYDELPEVLINAVIATEDSRFFQHNGFDFARFVKASLGQAMGNDSGGASTLTMQLVKNNYTSSNAKGIDGIVRKFTDIYMAIFKIEKHYTKEEIIEFYVNSQWFAPGGTNYGDISGVEQASQYFFGKSIQDLNLSEAAMIAGMFNNPSYYNPYIRPEKTQERRDVVLDLMYRHGYISDTERDQAKSISIKSLVQPKNSNSSNNPYQAFIDYVIAEVKDKTGVYAYTTPIKIYTTLDTKVQNVLNEVQNDQNYYNSKGVNTELLQSGMAVTSVENGSIVALGAGKNYVPQGSNRATQRKQPGSTAKPLFDYGPLIEYNDAGTGMQFIDQMYNYKNGQTISNWDNKYYGAMTLKTALKDSRNIPALQAFHQVNPDNVSKFVKSLGIDYGANLYESASIGGFTGISPLESSAAYAAFARGGYYIEPYSYTKIEFIEDETVQEFKYKKERVMSEETAYMITDVLMAATSSGAAGKINVSGTQVAAKSGTTNIDSSAAKQYNISINTTPDHWVNTYSSEYSISLWVGFDDLKQGQLTSNPGTAIRTKIMSKLSNSIYSKNKTFSRPSGLVEVTIEKDTAPEKLASDFTPADMKISSIYKNGTQPTEVSNRYSKLDAPTNGKSETTGTTIALTWNPISMPDAINPTFLAEYYTKKNYFSDSIATTYYDSRIGRNNSELGQNGYQIYIKDAQGNLTSIGFTTNNFYNYTANGTETSYTFVIKSAYSIFKDNISDGLEIKATYNGPTADLELSLNGDNPYCIRQGGTYSETDITNPVKVMYGGVDITSSSTITQTNSINTNALGTYNIVYTVTYNNGTVNKTKTISRPVKVQTTCD